MAFGRIFQKFYIFDLNIFTPHNSSQFPQILFFYSSAIHLVICQLPSASFQFPWSMNLKLQVQKEFFWHNGRYIFWCCTGFSKIAPHISTKHPTLTFSSLETTLVVTSSPSFLKKYLSFWHKIPVFLFHSQRKHSPFLSYNLIDSFENQRKIWIGGTIHVLDVNKLWKIFKVFVFVEFFIIKKTIFLHIAIFTWEISKKTLGIVTFDKLGFFVNAFNNLC